MRQLFFKSTRLTQSEASRGKGKHLGRTRRGFTLETGDSYRSVCVLVV